MLHNFDLGVVVKLSEFRELLDFVKQKGLCGCFIPKSCLTEAHESQQSDLIELFTHTRDQGGEALLNFLREEGKRKCGQYFEFSTRITMVKSGTVIGKLFSEIAPRYLDRPGGYTRIIRLSKRRLGDNGKLVLLQLVGENEKVSKSF